MWREILVYNDDKMAISSLLPSLRASFNQDLFHIKQITASDIHKGILQRHASRFLVLPGIIGEISPYTEQLGNGEMHEVQKFMSHGRNALLTICAGSAFISKKTLYMPPHGTPRGRMSNIPLFNGLARGPVGPYGRACTADSRFSDVIVVPVRYKDMDGTWKDTGVCYGNGPALYPDDPNDPSVEILCTYTDIPDNPAAILRQSVGTGVAYMSCVLPEIAHQHVSPHPGLHNAQQLMADLKPHEPGRKALWDNLTTRIKRDLGL